MLHAARVRMPLPSVIRLLEYRRIPHQTLALSRKNILLRDRNTCQYCGVVLPSGELTLDQTVMDKEKGVVLSEERLRDTPGYHVLKQSFAQVLQGQ